MCYSTVVYHGQQ